MRFDPLTLEDAADFQLIANHRAVADAVAFLHYPVSLEAITRLIEEMRENDFFLGGRMLECGDLAAVVGMHRRAGGEIEIGYLIRHDRHREGLGSEAAAGLVTSVARRYPQDLIIAECRPENRESWRILEKLGFRATGQAGKRAGRVKLELRHPVGPGKE
jgi:RimJ/RimL family protein N-acetyltransferase